MIYKCSEKHLIEYLMLLQIQTEPALQYLSHIQIVDQEVLELRFQDGWREVCVSGVGGGGSIQEGAFIESFLSVRHRDRCFYTHYFILVTSKSIETC